MIDITDDLTLLIGGSLTSTRIPVKCVSKLLATFQHDWTRYCDNNRACHEVCCSGGKTNMAMCVNCNCYIGGSLAETYYYNHDKTKINPLVGNHFRFFQCTHQNSFAFCSRILSVYGSTWTSGLLRTTFFKSLILFNRWPKIIVILFEHL